MKPTRRDAIRLGLVLGGAATLAGPLGAGRAQGQAMGDERFLFVVTAGGGASIFDSFLPIAATELATPEQAAQRPVYAERMIAQPPGSALRCVRNLDDALANVPFRSGYDMTDFLATHHPDMSVVTVDHSSVNHNIAQFRSMTGNGINAGRTITEAVALTHGATRPLPNCLLSSGGFIEPGTDRTLPQRARGVIISDARRFALSTHGFRGVKGAPAAAAMSRARAARDTLEAASPFGQRFAHSRLRRDFLGLRAGASAQVEGANLISTLLLVRDAAARGQTLQPSPELDHLRAHLPTLDEDVLAAQAALAFLLTRHQVSSAVTFGPTFVPSGSSEDSTFNGTPLAFDFAHVNHLAAQNVNWSRLMQVVDGLISLLKAQRWTSGTMWDRSVIYVATDFGRTKEIGSGLDLTTFSSGHDQRNGALLISPLIRGNRVYGRVDPETFDVFGFDPQTGAATDERAKDTGQVYSLIAQAMGIDFSGRLDAPGLLA